MIFYILAMVCIAAAEPDPRAAVYAVDGVQGLIYEFPEYEDPDMAMFQLSEMGAMPVLTVLEMVKEPEDSPKEKDTTYYEQLADVKKGLDDVIARLNMAKAKLAKGNTRIFIDIDKSIHNLKKLERNLRMDVHAIGTSVHLSLPFSSDRDSKDVTPAAEISFSTQTPISTESADFEDYHKEKKIETPFGDSILISESNRYEDGERAALRKKWTWKSSSID